MNNQDKETVLLQLKNDVARCVRCPLYTTRTQTVFGEGSWDAAIMFIGEGPGREEDIQGRPFVGRSGKLLTSIIENGMGLTREDVYIANIVKCRPTVNMAFQKDRPPDADEISACSSYLFRQIEIIEPEVIVTLGSPSTKFLLNTTTGITRLRGKWFDYKGIPVMPTFHPSYVLRNGGEKSPLKKDVWHDIKLVMEKTGLL